MEVTKLACRGRRRREIKFKKKGLGKRRINEGM